MGAPGGAWGRQHSFRARDRSEGSDRRKATTLEELCSALCTAKCARGRQLHGIRACPSGMRRRADAIRSDLDTLYSRAQVPAQ